MFKNVEQFKAYVMGQMAPSQAKITKNFKKVKGAGKDAKTIPIVINNFNRLSCTKKLIDYLQSKDYNNIYVIDNNSTYEPLLEYYDKEKINVLFLSENVGYLSLFKTKAKEMFCHQYYVYTDPDVLPVDECPDDFLEHFKNTLNKHKDIMKVGFSLKIDDLPNHNPLKENIINHESQFWAKNRIISDGIYKSAIDTTFALYKPNVVGGWWVPSIRVAEPYTARHLPWYDDPNNLTEEDVYYKNSVTQSTHWTQLK